MKSIPGLNGTRSTQKSVQKARPAPRIPSVGDGRHNLPKGMPKGESYKIPDPLKGGK